MKHILSFSTLVLCTFSSFAQQNQMHESCGTTEHLEWLKSVYPGIGQKLIDQENQMQKYEQHHAHDNSGTRGGVITIPVVVHIVYFNSSENISDAQIQTQIDVLNKDFRRLNLDAANTPVVWQGIAADFELEFCLASRDENNLPTTGIIRTQTNDADFGTDDQVKYSGQGGDDAWDMDSYLNIWVCDLTSGFLGYAQFPNGGPASSDGVVVDYQAFGTTGTAQYPYNKGRTTTHEVGHWVGLFHIWGDDGGNCTGSDQVNDTPNQGDNNWGCPSYPVTDNCSLNSPGVMYMNYMDYTDDACTNLFTNGQKTRKNSTFSGVRAPLANSQGCIPLVLEQNDASVLEILYPAGTICSSDITPQIELMNMGANTLTSVTINYQISGVGGNTYSWTGNLASLQTTIINLPSITSTSGAHTITATTSNPNGNADGNSSNDSQTENFYLSGTTGVAIPMQEGFENAGFPPAAWEVVNPDASYTWERTTQAASTGTASMFINVYDYTSSNGQIEDMISPNYNLSAYLDPMLTFDVAYALYSSTGFSDTLEVLISTDCGTTWTQLYKKYDAPLTTAPLTTNPFYPTSTQWRTETVDLSNYYTSSNAQIKFRFISDWENNLFIDDINISGTVENPNGINEISENDILVYPNPATENLFMKMNGAFSGKQLTLLDIVGREVKSQMITDNETKMDVHDLARGVYLLKISSSEINFTRKIVVE